MPEELLKDQLEQEGEDSQLEGGAPPEGGDPQSPENYKAEAEKWRKQHHDLKDEVSSLKDKYTNLLEKGQNDNEQLPKDNPKFQYIERNSMPTAQWDEVLEKRGYVLKDEIGESTMNRNEKLMAIERIIDEHNRKVDNELLKHENAQIKRQLSENRLDMSTEEGQRDKIRKYLDEM